MADAPRQPKPPASDTAATSRWYETPPCRRASPGARSAGHVSQSRATHAGSRRYAWSCDAHGDSARRRDHGQRLRPAVMQARGRRPRRVRGARTRCGSSPPTARPTCSTSTRAPPPTAACSVIIAGAGGAAHLPGMTASMTPLPVIGVPVPRENLDGLDSLLSIVQMPAGIPVATVGDRQGPQRRPARGPHPRGDEPRAPPPMERSRPSLADAVREKDDARPQAVRVTAHS